MVVYVSLTLLGCFARAHMQEDGPFAFAASDSPYTLEYHRKYPSHQVGDLRDFPHPYGRGVDDSALYLRAAFDV